MTIKFENNASHSQTDVKNLNDLLKNITPEDFLGLGVHDIAYIRPIETNGKTHYAIHAANGMPLSVMEDRDKALGTLLQQDLRAVTVH